MIIVKGVSEIERSSAQRLSLGEEGIGFGSHIQGKGISSPHYHAAGLDVNPKELEQSHWGNELTSFKSAASARIAGSGTGLEGNPILKC